MNKYSFKVSTEYIAFVKRKHSIQMQANRLKESAIHHVPIFKEHGKSDFLMLY